MSKVTSETTASIVNGKLFSLKVSYVGDHAIDTTYKIDDLRVDEETYYDEREINLNAES